MKKYIQRPVSINSEKEFEILTKRVGALLQKDSLSKYEEIEFRLVSNLVENYDNQYYSLDEIDTLDIIKNVMEDLGHTNKDLAEILGDKGIASRILNGKRNVSKSNALKISAAYDIPVEILIK